MPSLDNARSSPAGPAPTISPRSERHLLIRRAFLLEWLTFAWMFVEAIVAMVAAVAAHSLSLLAFGIDSLIELISACVLLWRLSAELKRGKTFSERAERTASRIGGGLLFALALYVVVSTAFSFWHGRGQDFSAVGLALTVVAIPIMWWLARAKLAIAEQLGSRALKTDSVESIRVAICQRPLLSDCLPNFYWVPGGWTASPRSRSCIFS